MVKKEVFGLEVSVDDAELVEVLDAADDLLEELAGLDLFQLLLFDDIVEQFASTHELHYQEQLLWRV